MPPATLFEVEHEGGERKPVSSYSYKIGESFADARLKLAAQFEFEFDFIDVNLNTRMLSKWEPHNLVEDCGGKVIIIPRNGRDPQNATVRTPTPGLQQVLGSSNASNGPAWTDSDDCIPPRSVGEPEVHPILESEEPIAEPDPQVTLLSIVMSSDLKRVWTQSVEKLLIYMESINCADHKWKVKTWDKDNQPRGHIECCECDTRVDGTSKVGLMDKISIANAFTNYKSKHLRSSKHSSRVASNRGETVDPQEIARRASSNTMSDRAILDQHLSIVAKINDSQPVGGDTFTVVGNVANDPVELHKFKLFCNFCLCHLSLIPRQRNLESNLNAHCIGLSHLDYVSKSQRPARNEPVLSGRPGRPRTVDGRDVKQRTIQGYLTRSSDVAASSSSSRMSATSNDKGTIDNLSLLCWGLWRDEVDYGSESRPIKGILNDQVRVDGKWFAEPHARVEVWCLSSQLTCNVIGLFRHIECARISTEGGGFEDLTCSKCFSIRTCDDFRRRVEREQRAPEKRGWRGTGKGRRLDYLTVPEIQRQAKRYKQTLLRERKVQRVLSHRLLMLKSPAVTIRQVCLNYQGPDKASVLKTCQSIVLAHKNGAFGGRGALWDMLSDIASNLNRSKTGYRFKPGTKLLCQTLFLHGGRRVVDCLATNRIGPSLVTLQRDRKDMIGFRAGIHASQFKFIADIYSQIKERLGIVGPIPFYLAEDETCVKRTVRCFFPLKVLWKFISRTTHVCCLITQSTVLPLK